MTVRVDQLLGKRVIFQRYTSGGKERGTMLFTCGERSFKYVIPGEVTGKIVKVTPGGRVRHKGRTEYRYDVVSCLVRLDNTVGGRRHATAIFDPNLGHMINPAVRLVEQPFFRKAISRYSALPHRRCSDVTGCTEPVPDEEKCR